MKSPDKTKKKLKMKTESVVTLYYYHLLLIILFSLIIMFYQLNQTTHLPKFQDKVRSQILTSPTFSFIIHKYDMIIQDLELFNMKYSLAKKNMNATVHLISHIANTFL